MLALVIAYLCIRRFYTLHVFLINQELCVHLFIHDFIQSDLQMKKIVQAFYLTSHSMQQIVERK